MIYFSRESLPGPSRLPNLPDLEGIAIESSEQLDISLSQVTNCSSVILLFQ